jgi:hypothetical protein
MLDYLLVGGAALAAGYLVKRLFVGWRLSSNDTRRVDSAPDEQKNSAE